MGRPQEDGITAEDPAYLVVQESIKHFPIPLRKSLKVIAEGDFLELDKDIIKRQETYRNFLSNFNEEEERLFENLEQPQGSKEFINRLTKKNGRFIAKRRGRPRERIVS